MSDTKILNQAEWHSADKEPYREMLERNTLPGGIEYWKRQLEGVQVLELATDHARLPVQTYRSSYEEFQIGPRITTKLNELARQQGATMFMVLLAAFKVLLYRYSGQTDLAVGTPIAGRNWAETEDLIGLFVNTLVLRTRLQPQASFKQLLAAVKQVCLSAWAHQEIPFEKLVEQLQPQRDMSRSPLFQVMFAYQTLDKEHWRLPGLSTSSIAIEDTTAKFDLTLTMAESGAGVAATLEYNADLYQAATIQRMSRHLQNLLEAIADDPNQPVGELQLMSDAELQQVLVQWNQTHRDYPQEGCIHELFEQQAARTPQQVAVVFDKQEISYSQLNQRANQLANYLVSLGVEAESLVGLCLERSDEMIVGLLAILKAGGAYVPLDASYPAERLAYLMGDAGLSLLLTQASLQEQLPETAARRVVVEQEQEAIARQSGDNLGRRAESQNLAYVIYTSGSTGKPKGVAIQHQSTVTMLQWAAEVFSAADAAAVLASTSICFDLSVFEIMLPLSQGGKLVLVENALAVSRVMGEISLINTVPSAIVEMLRMEMLPGSLRVVNLAGEALKRRVVEEVMRSGGVERVYNLYGPSEDTTYSTYAEVSRTVGEPSIGRPISNTAVYVLDERQQPVAVGVSGEMYIAGEGLGRGYLHEAEQTAARFVPNPYSRRGGERMYRTGDVCRYQADGEIEYLGRLDQQVKVRGYRIELGEIEAVLAGHPAIRECVVVVREEPPGNKRLVGYVVGEETGRAEARELREYVKGKLPEYMVPAVIIELEEMPRTPNGKLDRRRLAEEEGVGEEGEASYEEARTAVEEVLVEIWGELLAVPRVGVSDNFFALGGHSLLLTQVISRIRKQMQVSVGIREMFEHPTIEGLAKRIEARRAEGGKPAAGVERVRRGGELPLSFAQQRLWFLQQMWPESRAYNLVEAVRLRGKLDEEVMEEAMREIVRRHEVLRTRIEEREEGWVQVIEEEVKIRVEKQEVRGEGGEEEARRIGGEEARRGFELGGGETLRVKLVKLGEEENVLIVTMHHIVSDDWSMEVFADELAALYEAYREGKPSPLEELEIQYADYAVWQREWLQGEILEQHLSYWKDQLAGLEPIELISDKARPQIQTFSGGTISLTVEEALSERLRELGRREGATMFMVLLAAFKVLLYRYSGQTDLAVGTPVAGRNRLEIEPLIGFFVNTLVLRTRLQPQASFRQLLAAVKQVCLSAWAHQEIPFEKLVEQLQPQRDMSRSPLFQVMFAYQTLDKEHWRLPGLSTSSIAIEDTTAKFDLTLTMAESGAGVAATLEYNADLYQAATIQRMSRHLQNLLEAIADDPNQPVGELQLMSEAELQQVLVQWNQTHRDYPQEGCIHELFEQQAARTPQQVAVVFDKQEISYSQLNQRANQLANYLVSLGVEAESLVGLCLERSDEMIVGLLAILKAGGAYVPLDASYPAERLAYLMGDAGLSLLLTQASLQEQLPETAARRVVVEQEQEAIARQSGDNLGRRAESQNLAYVIYTSGSTGKPKGVAIQHQSTVTMLQWAAEVFSAADAAAVLASTSICFDLSVFEIMLPLSQGGKLVLVENALAVSRVMGEISLINTVPSAIVEMLRMEMLPGSLRVVNLAGEALKRRVVEEVMRSGGVERVYNLYGPSEDTTYSTYAEVSRTVGEPSIGRPISNTAVYLLDERQQPVAVGVSGEMYIAGEGLGRGYLHEAEQTAARFVPNPYSQRGGERMYRTGDVCRYQADGEIEYLGRLDQQVKVRGYRIELGEIEAVLGGHPAIRECVVVVREESPGNKRLVGYVVGEAAGRSEGLRQELREYVKGKLPEYMVPAVIVELEEMPKTPNGKLDRRRLAEEEGVGEEGEASYEEARTAVEEVLVEIWGELLAVPRVGVSDNFFALGGHSLLATQLASRLKNRFELKISLRSLFEKPTVSEMALLIEKALIDEIDTLSDDEVQQFLEEGY